MADDRSTRTDRAVYIQRLDPDQIDAYVDAHDSVPTAVTDAMERGGVEQFELYLRGDLAVCILEAGSLEAYLDTVTGDPEVEAWERHVSQFKQSGVDVDAPPDEQIPFMARIWSFEPESAD